MAGPPSVRPAGATLVGPRHKLLERQLKRSFGDLSRVPPQMQAFLAEVDKTYQDSDEDRRLLEHSMDLASQELLQANDELRQQHQEQQLIFDTVPAMILFKDADNRILRANEVAGRFLNRPVKELEGASCYDLYPPEVAGQLHADDLEVIRTGEPKLAIVSEQPGPQRDRRWVRTDKVPFRDPAGRVAGVIVFSVDITESRLAQDAVRSSEERYRQILETAGEGIMILDAASRITFANPVVASLLGLDRGALEGAAAAKFLHPEDELRVGREFGDVARGRRPVQSDLRLLRPDGTTVWVHASVAPTAGPDGAPDGLLAMLSDITDRRRADEELHAAYERLQQVDRARAQFLNTAAHELGTPLTPLALQVRVVRDRFAATMSPDQARSLQILQRSVERLVALVRDLLDAARLQTSRLRLDVGPLDVLEVARQSAQAFGDVATAAGVELSVAGDGPLMVRADGRRLGQVMDNLLSNAIKFSRPGGRVAVRLQGVGESVTVSVTDDGIGLAPESVGRLFLPFSQVHDTMQVNQPGTGLGLYICRGILEQSGGTIGVSSPGLGRGTTFVVRLPALATTPLSRPAAKA
ncbi:MAG: sensor histidine kinase [Thermoplasmatota archaeon]